MKLSFLALLVYLDFSIVQATLLAGEERVVTSSEIILEHPERATPEKDCERAIAKHDLRFVGIISFTLSVPGVENYDARFSKTNGVKVIRGTTDTPVGDDQVSFQYRAESYAEKYNRRLLQYLKKRDGRNVKPNMRRQKGSILDDLLPERGISKRAFGHSLERRVKHK